MTWKLPPEDVRRRVNAAFGTDMYARLAEVWQATITSLPGPTPAYTREQQTRFNPPERVTNAQGPVSAESAHYLGLGFDVSGLTPEAKAKLAEILNVTQIRTGTGMIVPIVVEGMFGKPWKPGAQLPPGHLHWGVGRAQLKRMGMIPYIQELVAGLRGRIIAGR